VLAYDVVNQKFSSMKKVSEGRYIYKSLIVGDCSIRAPLLWTFINVTGPVKTEHLGTNYTLSHNWSFLSTTEYLLFVTFTIKSGWQISWP